jgi:hypothetical protein
VSLQREIAFDAAMAPLNSAVLTNRAQDRVGIVVRIGGHEVTLEFHPSAMALRDRVELARRIAIAIQSPETLGDPPATRHLPLEAHPTPALDEDASHGVDDVLRLMRRHTHPVDAIALGQRTRPPANIRAMRRRRRMRAALYLFCVLAGAAVYLYWRTR